MQAGIGSRFVFWGVFLLGVVPALAQHPPRQTVNSESELPRFTFPVKGTATQLLEADDAVFLPFAARVKSEIEDVLRTYDIRDRATLRNLLTVKCQVEELEGQNHAARQTIAQIRELEDKPDNRLLSGTQDLALLDAKETSAQVTGAAFQEAYRNAYASELAPLPWSAVGARLERIRVRAAFRNTSSLIGAVQTDIDPGVSKTHTVSGASAWQLIADRFAIRCLVPLDSVTVAVLSHEMTSKKTVAPDIWKDREVALGRGDQLTPVNVAIWDGGSDVFLFPGRVYQDADAGPLSDSHGIAFDIESRPTYGDLVPLSAAERQDYLQALDYIQGRLDFFQGVDSSEASRAQALYKSLTTSQMPAFLEEQTRAGYYLHGTHVAGIAARGNPAIRLASARITWDWHNIPPPPTPQSVEQRSAMFRTTVAWFAKHHVRVVNMSWAYDHQEFEEALERNGIGTDAAKRKELADKYFALERDSLYKAMQQAPDVLFVCAAGNSDNSAAFEEDIPASFHLPNLIAVGAVDSAGQETDFSSYGPTVLVDANGFMVDSLVPGGSTLRMSGTSMAAPQVTNLAAKLIALDPTLSPERTIQLIVSGTQSSANGRLHNINPKRSVAVLQAAQRSQ